MSDKIAAWYSPAKDFAAGVDPTGTSTFRLASKYKGGHKTHRTIGDAGGFIGGTALGAALPAAMIGLTGLALRKKMKPLSQEFMTAAKGSLDVLNPKALYRHFKSIPSIVKYKKDIMGTMRQGRNLGARAKQGEAIAARARSGTLPTAREEARLRKVKSVGDAFSKKQELIQASEKNISKKYYGGRPMEIGRTMTALTTIPAAVATGILNTSSAHMQYNEALNQRRARGEKVASMSLLEKLAAEISTSNAKGFVVDMEKAATENTNFRKVLYTGKTSQLVLMSLKPNEDIGMEAHNTIDQFFRVDGGSGKVTINGTDHALKNGSAFVIPQGTKHNVIAGKDGMKLYTVYSPPNHADGTIRKTKADAEKNKEHFDGNTSE